MWIRDHLAWIVLRIEAPADELVETELFWTRDFGDAGDRRSQCDSADRARDVVGRHGLDQDGCEPHRVCVGCSIGDALDELEELRRVDDRVRDRRFLDQLLLGNLGAEVAALGKPIGSHDRQRDVVGDAFGGFNVEQIAG